MLNGSLYGLCKTNILNNVPMVISFNCIKFKINLNCNLFNQTKHGVQLEYNHYN